MKIFLALGAAVFLATSAGAAEMGYQFKTIDINGAPGQTSFPAGSSNSRRRIGSDRVGLRLTVSLPIADSREPIADSS